MSYAPYRPSATQLDPGLPPPSIAQAGWHPRQELIPTLVGLAGTFYWPENPFRPAQISFTFPSGTEGFAGTYVIRSGMTTIDEGRFSCWPGVFPAIVLLPANGALLRGVRIEGIFTDAAWRIHFMLLTGESSTFLAFRTA